MASWSCLHMIADARGRILKVTHQGAARIWHRGEYSYWPTRRGPGGVCYLRLPCSWNVREFSLRCRKCEFLRSPYAAQWALHVLSLKCEFQWGIWTRVANTWFIRPLSVCRPTAPRSVRTFFYTINPCAKRRHRHADNVYIRHVTCL